MPLTGKELSALQQRAKKLRKDIVDTTVWAGGAHIGGANSIVDILNILYFKYARVDTKNPQWADRDRIIVSKGHAGVGVAAVLAEKGFYKKELLKTFNHFMSPFGMHLDCHRVPGLDVSTGSLGHGLAQGVGLAWGARFQGKDWKTFVILGDGECNEGSVWEAAMSASQFKLDNLITIVDRNGLMMDGTTEQVMGLEPFDKKWEAFGFKVRIIDGHDFTQLADALDFALENKGGPVVIIANTVKGKGVDFIENDVRWHYGSMDSALAKKAMESIDRMYE